MAEFQSLRTITTRIFHMIRHVFGILFTEVLDRMTGRNVWHKDVRLFLAYDNNGKSHEFLGYLYLDLLDRGGKRKEMKTATLIPVSERRRNTHEQTIDDGAGSYPAGRKSTIPCGCHGC